MSGGAARAADNPTCSAPPTGDTRVDAVIAAACAGGSNGTDAAFPCAWTVDVHYNRVTTSVDGQPVNKRFANFWMSGEMICREPVLQCVVVGLVGGAPAVVLGWGGPRDGVGSTCVVNRTYPDATGPIPSGAVIVAGVFTLSREQSVDWSAYFIT